VTWQAGGKRGLWQVVDRGFQRRLVALDAKHVIGVPLGDQPAGMVGLGVERILCRSLRYADVARGGRW
jgi:hypothetical protein